MLERPPLTEISKSDSEDPPAGSGSGVDENPPILKMFEREDWTLGRTVDGLQQKAGVPATRLRRLVLKELGDNALDTGAEIKFGEIDNGPGLDGTPEQIAELYSRGRGKSLLNLLPIKSLLQCLNHSPAGS